MLTSNKNELKNSSSSCDICGDLLNLKYTHTLPTCNHIYHYECIMKTFMFNKNKCNFCPLCRTKSGLLPIVNGLPKLIKDIHYIHYNNIPEYECKPCNATLKTGKRKGLECGSKCIIGSHICKRHHILHIKNNKK